MIERTITLREIIITRDPLPTPADIPEDLRQKIANHFDEQIMALSMFGPAPAPTTLYVEKHGHYSTVDPKAEAAFAHRNRAPFGFVVST